MTAAISAVMPWIAGVFLVLVVLWQAKRAWDEVGASRAKRESMEAGERAQQREDKARRGKRGRDLLDDLKRVRDANR
jgi:hypothetical protein